MQPRERRQLLAYAVAFVCFGVAIVLRLTKVENWLVLYWICLSVGVVAFVAGATLGRQGPMARPRFTMAETMVVLSTIAVTFGLGRALDLPWFGQVACAVVGLFGFAMVIWNRREPPA